MDQKLRSDFGSCPANCLLLLTEICEAYRFVLSARDCSGSGFMYVGLTVFMKYNFGRGSGGKKYLKVIFFCMNSSIQVCGDVPVPLTVLMLEC